MVKAKERIRNIDLEIRQGAFTAFFRKFGASGEQKGGINFNGITALRQLLSNEKARIMHVLSKKKPESIYALAKLLKRDFKSVRKDVELLKNFDLITLKKEEKGKRESLRPVPNLDILNIRLKF